MRVSELGNCKRDAPSCALKHVQCADSNCSNISIFEKDCVSPACLGTVAGSLTAVVTWGTEEEVGHEAACAIVEAAAAGRHWYPVDHFCQARKGPWPETSINHNGDVNEGSAHNSASMMANH